MIAILVCAAWISPLKSQVSSGGEVAAPSAVFDFTNASQTIPARKLSSDPAACIVGEQYFNTISNVLRVCTAANTWANLAGSVSSVGLSAPNNVFAITGSPVTATGTLTLTPAGNSGGIPYFSAASSMASSGLLVANGVVVGGGAASAPKSTGVTIDGANNISTAGTVTTGVGGSSHGKLALQELPSNGSATVGWEAPDLITSSLSLVYPNANPAANSVMLFPAPTGGQSQFNWVSFSSSNLIDSANLTRNNQSNTYSGGNQNFSAAASLELPVASGLTATANGQIGYDSAANLLHAAVNSVDSVIATRSTAVPVAGDCVKWAANGMLDDQGSTCGGSTTTSFTATNQGTTGTGLNQLAKLAGAPSTVLKSATADVGGAVGICTSGCGATGTATITYAGVAGCVFDGPTTADDYVQISSATAGDCHDAGANYPASNQVIGRVLSTNAAGGTYNILLFAPEVKAAGAGNTGRLAQCLDPTTRECIKESFVQGGPSSSIGEHGLSLSVGSGGTVIAVSTAGRPGVIQLNSNTTSGGSAQINLQQRDVNNGVFRADGDTADTKTIAKADTNDSNSVFRLGWGSNINSGQPGSGVYFEKLGADTSWFGVCRLAGTQTRTTAVATVDTSYHHFNITTTGGTISFNIDGGTVQTCATNVPTAQLFWFGLATNNSTTNNEQIEFDYFDAIVTVSR
ncbi:MAG TPA: hypothetical protein VJN43_12180 [Bryobacteraceae bacterium]|nr:hypothetical protein [Bryobacteraceae bacterium]